MRIGTWNVEYASGAVKNARRRDILDANPADVWVLTETHDDFDLTPAHQPIHSAQRPVRSGPDVRLGSRWVSIWSRFPVRERLSVRDPERTAAALLDTPVGALIVFGTVLPWHSDRGCHPIDTDVPNWSEQYRVIGEQSEEWKARQRDYREAAMCVAGDLNLNLGGPHWYGTNHGRAMMRSAIKHNDLICTTEFDEVPPGLLTHAPIDHVLLSRRLARTFRVAAAWEGRAADGVRLSDHSGIVVEF
jgi:exonuclease III